MSDTHEAHEVINQIAAMFRSIEESMNRGGINARGDLDEYFDKMGVNTRIDAARSILAAADLWKENHADAPDELKALIDGCMQRTVIATMQYAMAVAKARNQMLLDFSDEPPVDLCDPWDDKDLANNIAQRLERKPGEPVEQILPIFTRQGINNIDGSGRNAAENVASLQELSELLPYLQAELQDPKYGGVSLAEFFSSTAFLATSVHLSEPEKGTRWQGAVDALRLWQQLNLAAIEAQAKNIAPKIRTKKLTKIDYPVDKVNAGVWQKFAKADADGQITFNIGVEKRGSRKKIDITYSINFAEVEKEVVITKHLTQFDKRVYIAVANLIKSDDERKGGTVVVSDIYRAMGNRSRPDADSLKKINDSITKMNAAHIYLNNESEHAAYKNMPAFKYDGSLLPMERITATNNGQLTDAAIHVFREPPLVSFARQRNQITSVPIKLLESPLNKTEENLTLDDYLVERIARMKNAKGKSSNKILLETVYKQIELKHPSRDIPRVKAKIEKLLDHYQKCDFIKSYEVLEDGIEIHC